MEALFLQNLNFCYRAGLNIGISAAILAFQPSIIAVFEYVVYKVVIKGPAIFGLVCLILSTALISNAKEMEDYFSEEQQAED